MDLYTWASCSTEGIAYLFCSQEEIQQHSEELAKRIDLNLIERLLLKLESSYYVCQHCLWTQSFFLWKLYSLETLETTWIILLTKRWGIL